MYTSDSLETILSHLSTRVVDIIADGNHLLELNFLLGFLVAWEKRPKCLTPIAYQWCSVISEVIERLEPSEETGGEALMTGVRLRRRVPVPSKFSNILQFTEEGFSEVGRRCDILRLDDTSHPALGQPRDPVPDLYKLLRMALQIGFRLVTPDQPAPRLNHPPHHDRVLQAAFSCGDDEVVADAVSVWIADGDRDQAPPGSFAHYLAERVGQDRPFSARLRRASIRAIERIWCRELAASELEIVQLLDRLNVNVDDIASKDEWVKLLVNAIRSPAGLDCLSSHYWHLLGGLALDANIKWIPQLWETEVMESLEEAEDWEKLEAWMVIVLRSQGFNPSLWGVIWRVIFKLYSLQRPAFQRLLGLFGPQLMQVGRWRKSMASDQAQAAREQLAFGSLLPLLYVSVCPAQHLSVLISPFSLPQPTSSCPATHSTSFRPRRHLLKAFIMLIVGRCTEFECVFCLNVWSSHHLRA
jgi:hypothetical protein